MATLRSQIVELLAGIHIDFGGGCSASKAYVLASIIRETHTKSSLDIGVYRGRSLLPQALAHRRYTGGIAYGVDPWTKADAAQNDNAALKPSLDRFIDSTDFDAIYREVDERRTAASLQNHCMLLRRTSADAAQEFLNSGLKFGLIHIDGNHDTAAVLRDVVDFAPLLERGGVLVMDDVSWASVQPACDKLASTMRKVFQRIDAANDYAVFWKADAPLGDAPSWRHLLSEDYVVNG